MTIYLIAVIIACFLGMAGCAYIVGKIDGAAEERERAARVRRMSKGGYVPHNERNGR
jgi:hypothetical protein